MPKKRKTHNPSLETTERDHGRNDTEAGGAGRNNVTPFSILCDVEVSPPLLVPTTTTALKSPPLRRRWHFHPTIRSPTLTSFRYDAAHTGYIQRAAWCRILPADDDAVTIRREDLRRKLGARGRGERG